MKNKKIISLVIAITMLLTQFAICGGGNCLC